MTDMFHDAPQFPRINPDTILPSIQADMDIAIHVLPRCKDAWIHASIRERQLPPGEVNQRFHSNCPTLGRSMCTGKGPL